MFGFRREVLYAEHDESTSLYLILEGEVVIRDGAQGLGDAQRGGGGWGLACVSGRLVPLDRLPIEREAEPWGRA